MLYQKIQLRARVIELTSNNICTYQPFQPSIDVFFEHPQKIFPHQKEQLLLSIFNLFLQEVRHAVDDGLIVVTGGLHPGQSTNGTAALIAEKVHAEQFLNATDGDGVYDRDPNKFKKAKKFERIEIKNLKNMLVHEDSVAGGYDLMDILALKIIERSKIKTRIIKADPKIIEKAIKGGNVGTEIILSSK